jgi:hypothetical protein
VDSRQARVGYTAGVPWRDIFSGFRGKRVLDWPVLHRRAAGEQAGPRQLGVASSGVVHRQAFAERNGTNQRVPSSLETVSKRTGARFSYSTCNLRWLSQHSPSLMGAEYPDNSPRSMNINSVSQKTRHPTAGTAPPCTCCYHCYRSAVYRDFHCELPWESWISGLPRP